MSARDTQDPEQEEQLDSAVESEPDTADDDGLDENETDQDEVDVEDEQPM